MIGIVNYNAGNIKSVERALTNLSIDFLTSGDPKLLDDCERLIFPGVGDAQFAMEQLHTLKLDVFLKNYAKSGRPLLGICLGSQIIFSHSDEGDTDCLDLIKGTVRHLSKIVKKEKIPQIGWNDLTYHNGGAKILDGVPPNTDFYFVHSYYINPADSSVIKAVCNYGAAVPAVIECGNIFATQFHPEKSAKWGLKILSNFCNK